MIVALSLLRPRLAMGMLVALLLGMLSLHGPGQLQVAGAAELGADWAGVTTVVAELGDLGLDFQPTTTELALLEAANRDRLAHGLGTLEADAAMLRVARQRARAQLESTTLAHRDASGNLVFVELLAEAGLEYRLAGENLARADSSVQGDVVELVEQALMSSPSHRRNILEPSFGQLAVGVAMDETGRVAFAQIFRAAL